MIRILLTIFSSVFFILPAFAQRDYAKEIIDLLIKDRCFEARDLYIQNRDKLPQNDKKFDLIYKSRMSMFFNKPDSTTIYLEELLTNCIDSLGLSALSYYGYLLSAYDNNQQFEEGINLCDKSIEFIKRNIFNMDYDFFRNQINYVENKKSSFKDRALNQPRIRIERNKSGEVKAIQLNDGEFIRFNAEYNGIQVETLFDTGTSFHFCMTKRLADKIGVKVISKDQDSIKNINNIPTRAFDGIIDSINIGDIKFYNIPVLVFYESMTASIPDTLDKSRIKSLFSDTQIMMGLPIMKMIGKFEFDWKIRMLSFPENTKIPVSNNSSNIFSAKNDLYIQLKINKLNYTGYIDTGSDDFLHMTFSFYEKNKSNIKIDSITQKLIINNFFITGYFIDIPYEITKDVDIYFTNKYINSADQKILITDSPVSHMNTFDGYLGIHFFKKLGSKVVFDFDNMKIEGRD